jgi:hypothetical protein
MNKTSLLASFIFPERLEWFLSYLEAKFSIGKEKVFCYKDENDESKLIVTFKLSMPEDKSLNLKELFPSAITIHKKGNALYTINALNKLIDEKAQESIGNIEHKDVKINWEEYQGNFILIKDKELKILSISRVF